MDVIIYTCTNHSYIKLEKGPKYALWNMDTGKKLTGTTQKENRHFFHAKWY